MVTEDRLISAQTKETFSPLINKIFQFFPRPLCSACSSLKVSYKSQGTSCPKNSEFGHINDPLGLILRKPWYNKQTFSTHFHFQTLTLNSFEINYISVKHRWLLKAELIRKIKCINKQSRLLVRNLNRIWPIGSFLCPNSELYRHDVP